MAPVFHKRSSKLSGCERSRLPEYVTRCGAAYSYNVIDAVTAFVLLILAVGTGIAIGARTGLVVVAIVSLVGGYLAPILLRTDHPSPYVLPVYLIALLVVGLALSAWLFRLSAVPTCICSLSVIIAMSPVR